MRMIVFDRGGIVDEYASVPEFHGPLPPGEVIALHANPVVVERYTGASQASVRAAAPGRERRRPTCRPPASCSPGSPPRSASPAPSTAGPTRPTERRRAQDRPLMLRLVDAPRCPYCARVRIMLAEKGVAARGRRDRPRGPARLALRAQPGRPGAGRGGGRLGAAGVGRDQRVPRGALPRAAAPAGRSRRRARGAPARSSATTTSPTPYYALRRGEAGADDAFAAALAELDATLAGAPSSRATAFGLADIALVPWVIRARDLLGVSLELVPARRRLARPASRNGRRSPPRSRSSRPCERRHPRRARAPPRRGRARRCSTCAPPASTRARPGTRAITGRGTCPGRATSICRQLLEAGDAAAIRALVGAPEGAEVIAYCHSGGRSAMAAQLLAAAGYEARNYVGSWHEWSADRELPIE